MALLLLAQNLTRSPTETDESRPECKEKEQPGTDGIGIRVRPYTRLSKENDTEQRPRADRQQPEADLHEPIFAIILHSRCSSVDHGRYRCSDCCLLFNHPLGADRSDLFPLGFKHEIVTETPSFMEDCPRTMSLGNEAGRRRRDCQVI